MNNIKNFYAIYSVGTKDFWLDDLKNWKKWIYIYKNSLETLNEIKKWDIIVFLRTGKEHLYLFEFTEKISENGNDYIILPEENYLHNNIAIAAFKNLYFLNFDSLKSWVRSPLWSGKNILKFESGEDILEKFVNLEQLNNVFKNIANYQRRYFIGKYNKLEDEKNIYLSTFDRDNFWKEYSVFANNWDNKYISTDLGEIIKYKNQSWESREYYSYTSYYDFSRVLNSTNKLNENIIEIEKQVQSNPNNPDLKIDLEQEKDHKKRMDDEYFREKSGENTRAEEDHSMKKKIFNIVIYALLIELLVIFIIFILIWLGVLVYKGTDVNVFIWATIMQMMVVFWIIVKALFKVSWK